MCTSVLRKAAVMLAGFTAIMIVAGATVFASSEKPRDAERTEYDADPYRQVVLTQASAVDRVKQVVDVSQRQLRGTSDVLSMVDVHDGHVLSLLLPKLTPSSTTVSMSADQALAAASAFLDSQSISTAGLTPAVIIKDRGAIRTYQVSWQRTVNGVTVPDSRMVEIDAVAGVVFHFVWTTRPYSDPPPPAVSRDRAVQLACAAVDQLKGSSPSSGPAIKSSCSLDGADLSITFSRDGVQAETWSIRVTVDGWRYKFSVDAADGTTVFDGAA
jgi:hypothetical protein